MSGPSCSTTTKCFIAYYVRATNDFIVYYAIKTDVSLPTMPKDVIATPVPLADPLQQAISSDLSQQDVSPHLPQHHLYVDDIVLTGNNTNCIAHFTNILSTNLTLKDMGFLSHFLGIEAISTSTELFLSQAKYISDILTQFQMENAKTISTPMSSSNKLPLSKPSMATDISRGEVEERANEHELQSASAPRSTQGK
ncbi:hypothetical protein V6N12_049167 [Hibiscus sabdariffa]|uniref:Reverse transcriptase Ty1/copia-type domain-containing protein n=1 Tax=Hibiscus sabdariffa TaxID=183260 RepID=A0ABR2EJD8_9ROSI